MDYPSPRRKSRPEHQNASSTPKEKRMILALDPITKIVVHVSLATPDKEYECMHKNCGDRVKAYDFGRGHLAYGHFTNPQCIGVNTPRGEIWTPPPGYTRPPAAK
jgi:hypothetical protein